MEPPRVVDRRDRLSDEAATSRSTHLRDGTCDGPQSRRLSGGAPLCDRVGGISVVRRVAPAITGKREGENIRPAVFKLIRCVEEG